ncbi:SH2 domain-containing protein 3C-like isoform X2 [Patiria miniata]|nr:SH2 domain-containing protein 3C-like isoform X2 [Patiria miniata]XP_038045959.1 SH2 domain-containing protein 3C-like isoform X2 [Patiria miniata]
MAFHLTIENWLSALELEEYIPLFQHYQTVENLLHLSERHISELGVSNSAHRARLASNLVYIREKLKRSSIAGSPLMSSLTSSRQRSSIAGSPYSSPVPSPSTKASFRYSTIPEGVTPELPPSPKTFKMDYQDTSPEDLRKELEAELKLPNNDIRSHAWFHGGISRDKVEKLLMSNGDFLVRDSISQPGNYVLSVCWRNSPMHFVINRVVLQADTPYASIQYQFERECFDSIPSLIRFYIGNARPISQTSAAVIQRPVNRSVPLSFIDSKYAAINRSQASAYTYGVLPRRVVTPRLALGQDNFRQRSGSQPAIMRNSVVDPALLGRSESSPTINRPMNGFAVQPLNDKSEHRPLGRTGSEPIIESPDKVDYVYPAPNASSSEDLTAPPLPPSRTNKSSGESITNGNVASLTETINVVNRGFDPPNMFVVDHVYSEIDQYDPLPIRFSVLHDKSDSKPTLQEENGNEPDLKEKKRHSDTRNSVLDTDYSKVAEMDKDVDKRPEKLVTPLPQMEEPSCIHLSDFTTSLMGSENKPLEGTILAEVKQRLLDTDPVVLAKHITTIDFEMCRITDTSSRQPGLEVITLPQGVQIRQDLLERYNCLKTWCGVCVLTCTEPEQRIRMLHQWIQVAEALRGSLGNLFSFTAVMDGLGCKQLTQLKKSWELLRSMHTSSAVNYETKLRSLLKSLNSGENALPLTKTSVPHIVPVIQLLERDWTTLTATDWSTPASKDTLEGLPRGESWEESSTGFGLDALLNHLQNAHTFCQQTNLYRINANTKLTKFLPDQALLDACRPEFQMRMLWGSKGATAGTAERYQKFQKILGVMAEKIEPIGPGV